VLQEKEHQVTTNFAPNANALGNAGRLANLLDMLRLLASEWNELNRQIESLVNALNVGLIEALAKGPREVVLNPLRNIHKLCLAMGLDFSASYAAEIIEYVECSPLMGEIDMMTILAAKSDDWKRVLDPSRFQGEVSILRKRIDDQLAGVEFFSIEPGKSAYILDPYPFGLEVANAFPSAIVDLEESNKCFAFSRYTASVFHLMRVIEVGLRALGKSLNDPSLDPKNNPNWGTILSRCDKELAKRPSQRSPDWGSDEEFFSNATANLRAVKDAWRNRTMHVEISYDEARATDVRSTVRVFMRHLATKLSE